MPRKEKLSTATLKKVKGGTLPMEQVSLNYTEIKILALYANLWDPPKGCPAGIICKLGVNLKSTSKTSKKDRRGERIKEIMPNSPKKTTKRKRSTLKKLSATTKEVTRKNMKGIKGKGLAPTPLSSAVLIGAAPAVTVGVAPQLSNTIPKITVT